MRHKTSQEYLEERIYHARIAEEREREQSRVEFDTDGIALEPCPIQPNESPKFYDECRACPAFLDSIGFTVFCKAKREIVLRAEDIKPSETGKSGG